MNGLLGVKTCYGYSGSLEIYSQAKAATFFPDRRRGVCNGSKPESQNQEALKPVVSGEGASPQGASGKSLSHPELGTCFP